jgi:hypothetical protein
MLAAVVVMTAPVAGCAGDDAGTSSPTTLEQQASTSTTATEAPVVAPSTTVDIPATTQPPEAPPSDSAPPESAPPESAPSYGATVAPIDESTRARMTYSWRDGCPVPPEDLRLLTLPHWDDAGASVLGELVVHADAADAMVDAFGRLYALRFPIARMELVDVYLGDDDASMRANNTSAFNCREIDGQPGTWSQHSYGRAVDVNPLVNPWVRGTQVDPPEGASYADRSIRVPGGIYAGDEVVTAFASVGWKWGGNWSGSKDYQHFSANGR